MKTENIQTWSYDDYVKSEFRGDRWTIVDANFAKYPRQGDIYIWVTNWPDRHMPNPLLARLIAAGPR